MKHLLSNMKLYSIMLHFDDLKVINVNILRFSETTFTDLLLYGKERSDKIQNKVNLTVSIKFIVDSDRFMVLFFSIRYNFIHLFYC